MTWKNRKRLAMVRIQLRKTLKYLLHVGFTGKGLEPTALRAFLLYCENRMQLRQVSFSSLKTSKAWSQFVLQAFYFKEKSS